jgi:PAS domain S-box-containing protein
MEWTYFITRLFDQSFASRWTGTCSGWTKELVVAHVVADISIWLAYLTIPVLLVKLAKNKKDLPFNLLFLLFALFIVGCGTTHLMGAITAFFPYYYMDFWVKFITAAASIGTAWVLCRAYPLMLKLPNPFAALATIEAANKELRKSEESVRMLVEGTKDVAIFMLDREGRVVTWSSAAEGMKQYRADEIIGRHFSCFYSEEDIESGKPEQELRAAINKGKTIIDGWRYKKDGSRYYANIIISTLYNSSGDVCGFSKVTRDITEKWKVNKKLEKVNKN